ncbi:MAG: hypothetical protein ACK4ND_00070 [Cytophagaceae bacterium]
MNKLLTLLIILTLSSCGNRQERYEKAQNAVSGWIKKYALYPDSYEPVSFGEYSESVSKRHNKKIPNSENYIIKHTHRILDKDSNLTTFSGYFFLEHDYYVSMIETEPGNSISGPFPPRTQVWTDYYRRPMNRQDSIELNQRRERVKKKLINQLKNDLKTGTVHTDDPEGLEMIKELLEQHEVTE